MRKSLLEILACPIDKHSPLKLFEINIQLANESLSDKQDENGMALEGRTDNDTTFDNVIVKEGVLFCSRCSRFFPIIDEIPIMLPMSFEKGKKIYNSYKSGKLRFPA